MSISEKNPKLAKLAGQFIKFYAFSMLVTLLQYLLLTFLPGLFYAHTDWCSIPCQLIHLNLGPVDTYVFNYPVTGDATGGMGYFAAFAITLVRHRLCAHHHRVQLPHGPVCAPVQAVLLPGGVQRAHHRDQRRRADGDLFPHL